MIPASHADLVEIIRNELRAVKRTLTGDIAEHAHLREDLSLDSLDVLELVARLEQRFRIGVAESDWKTLTTVDRIACYLEARR